MPVPYKSLRKDPKPIGVSRRPDLPVFSPLQARWYLGGSHTTKKEIGMRGIVVHHERRIGYIVIRDPMGEFTIAELLGGYDVEKGHVIFGELHSDGSEILYNETSDEDLDVIIQGHGMSEQASIRMIRKIR